MTAPDEQEAFCKVEYFKNPDHLLYLLTLDIDIDTSLHYINNLVYFMNTKGIMCDHQYIYIYF